MDIKEQPLPATNPISIPAKNEQVSIDSFNENTVSYQQTKNRTLESEDLSLSEKMRLDARSSNSSKIHYEYDDSEQDYRWNKYDVSEKICTQMKNL